MARGLGKSFGIAILLAALAPCSARAVIIDTVDGAGNITVPADDPGWNNVGMRPVGGTDVLSGVYVGNRWVLTANHVGGGPIVLAGGTYAMAAGSGVQLTNAGAVGKTSAADLFLYQLTADPGLPMLSLASSAPGVGATVTMIGAGLNRGDYKEWLVSGTTWTENTANPNAAGYMWGSGQAMRWGTNNVSGSAWVNTSYDAFSRYTTFNDIFPSSEAQAAYGDSGGGVFFKSGGQWQLAGIILGVDRYVGQPTNAAVFGNNTYFADVSYYRDQIVTITAVPEPGGFVLTAVGIAFVLVRPVLRRFRRACGGEIVHEA